MLTSESLGASAATPAEGWLESRPDNAARSRRRGRWTTRFWLDALFLFAATVTTEVAAPDHIPPSEGIWLALFPVLVLALLRVRGMYRFRIQPNVLDRTRTLLGATSLAAITVLSVRVLVADSPAAAGQTVRHWLFATLALMVGHLALACSDVRARRTGTDARSTLIVGAGRIGQRAAKRLLSSPEFGLRPVGFLDKDPLFGRNGDGAGSVPVLGASWDLDRVVAEHDIEHVLIAFSNAPDDVLLRTARRCDELGVSVSFVPRLYEQVNGSVTVEHLGGLPLISVERKDPQSWHFGVKYAIDRVVGALLVVLLSPVFIAVGLAVWASLGNPIFFRQWRVGRDGREFRMLKFRSMKPSTEPGGSFVLPPDTAPGGVEGRDRRTRVGQFLRRTSLDELPQLINVARGEMSLVGPRPERSEFVAIFEPDVYRYGDRHRVRAGITGWAQVNGLRGKTSLADRVEWDNYYIDNWSLWLDFKILAMTVLALVRYRAE